jgi:diguanylate cyclase (GGDEF)-like protein
MESFEMLRMKVDEVPPLDPVAVIVRGRTSNLSAILVFAAVIFSGCLLGIFTRPVGHLSAFWPANALMLGMMIRDRRLATPFGLFAAGVAFICADLIKGGGLTATLFLTGANMIGAVTGYVFFSRLDRPNQRLQRPHSVLYLVVGASAAAAAAGMAGALINPILFGGSMLDGWIFWAVTELVNYIAILPVVLTMPAYKPRVGLKVIVAGYAKPAMLAPAIALILSGIAALLIGGPGAIGFPVPALLWCALVYTPFVTAILTLLFSCWTLLAIALSYIVLSLDSNDWSTLMSIRMGVTMIALAPITVASVTAARNELMHHLRQIAAHDPLTNLLNRGAFKARAQVLLAQLAEKKLPAAVLMLDIDHFKQINDTYGHAAGDCVLKTFGRIAKENLRDADVTGRLGGEEFAVLLTGPSCHHALAIAERIRSSFEQATIDIEDGRSVSAAISGGLVVVDHAVADIDALLIAADRSLYLAKQRGRNRITWDDARVDFSAPETERRKNPPLALVDRIG